jgi:serine/threonine protein kinase
MVTPAEQDVVASSGLGTPVEQVARSKAPLHWAPGATRLLHYDLDMPVEQDIVTDEIDRLFEGTLLENRYQIDRILSYGDFSVVYLARDMRFTRELRLCAIKEMVNTATDPAVFRMIMRNFERQANILAILSHPAIPQIYDYFKVANRTYTVIEYIEGKDPRVILGETEGFLPEERVVSWAIDICDALHHLHSHTPKSIVHRDVKPQHVLVDRQDRAYLLGFTIARVFDPKTKGVMIGTEGYTPPEQYRGSADPRADIYALGATMHHLLSKQDPTLEAPFSFHERPIHRTNPTVSRELTEIIDKALDYDINKRLGSVGEMKSALVAFLCPGDTPPT